MLPALAAWRRRERDRSVTGGWRYRITWVPVTEPGPAVLSGTWLVVVPAGQAGGDLAQGCVRALAGSRRPGGGRAEAAADELDRAALAARIGAALAGPDHAPRPAGVAGSLGWSRCWRWTRRRLPGYPVVSGGAGRDAGAGAGAG